jgi:hypothetical protein
MPRLMADVVLILMVLVDSLCFAYMWTEPPKSAGDYNRTYYLGETVPISWTVTPGQWPRLNLRISPAFITGIAYAILIGENTLALPGRENAINY